MIKHMFVFGVIIPTLITVIVFIGFLICWFKFNIRERIWAHKKLGKKVFTKQSLPHPIINGVHRVHVKYAKEGDDPNSPAKPKDNDNCNKDPDGKGNPPAFVLNNAKQCKNYENMEECEDPETALCMPQVGQSNSMQGISNPCSSPTELTVEVTKIDMMVQHTFHFPVSDATSGVNDSEDGSEDGNYGHFVPLAHVLKDPKAKQYFMANPDKFNKEQAPIFHTKCPEKLQKKKDLIKGKCVDNSAVHLLHKESSAIAAGV